METTEELDVFLKMHHHADTSNELLVRAFFFNLKRRVMGLEI